MTRSFNLEAIKVELHHPTVLFNLEILKAKLGSIKGQTTRPKHDKKETQNFHHIIQPIKGYDHELKHST